MGNIAVFKCLKHPIVQGTLVGMTLLFPTIVQGPAQAAAIRLGPLTFTEVRGDFEITGGTAGADGAGNPLFTLNTVVTGPDIDLFTRINGLPNLDGFIGFRFRNIVRNETGTPWTFFDHELQEVPRQPSPEADGLSFAQGINFVRPFSSNLLSRVDETTDVRDFVNFSGGVVQPGQTVVFNYAITDRSPIDTFFLRQRPNFQPGGAGFVQAPPPPPPPPPPIVVEPDPPVETDPPIVVEPDPPVDPDPPVVTEPDPPVETEPPIVIEPDPVVIDVDPPVVQDPDPDPVPGPGSLVGILMFGAITATYKRLNQR